MSCDTIPVLIITSIHQKVQVRLVLGGSFET